jgi:hypothetical protein
VWSYLYKNPNAIHLFEKNMDKTKLTYGNIDWSCLSGNQNAIHLLEQNMDIIDWSELSKNPSIFEINKKQLIEDIEKQARIIDKIIHQ